MQPNILLIVNSLLMLILTGILAYLIVTRISAATVAGYIKDGLNKMGDQYNERQIIREIKRHTRTVSIDMSLAEKVELYMIDKSNIRRFIPFMSFNLLILISIAIFAGSFAFVYRIFYFIPSTAVICLIFSLLPFYLLDVMGRHNSEVIKHKLAYFASVLHRWFAVKEDIFYAFEKSTDSRIGEPLNTFIKDMIIQVRGGMDPVAALEILQLKVDNEQFKDFILNIKQCVKHKGNAKNLLENMEEQLYKMEEEYNRRNISTYRDRITIVCVMLGVLFIGYTFLKTNPKVYGFYLGTDSGKLLLMLFTILYALGFYFFTRITKFKY